MGFSGGASTSCHMRHSPGSQSHRWPSSRRGMSRAIASSVRPSRTRSTRSSVRQACQWSPCSLTPLPGQLAPRLRQQRSEVRHLHDSVAGLHSGRTLHLVTDAACQGGAGAAGGHGHRYLAPSGYGRRYPGAELRHVHYVQGDVSFPGFLADCPVQPGVPGVGHNGDEGTFKVARTV